jgi:NADPH:quinone reductase
LQFEVKTMKAIYIQHPIAVTDLKVSEIPIPSMKPGDVLVEVTAAGINPSDLASVQGKLPGSVLPRVVGRDFAGRVVEGPSGLIGAEVWGTGGDLGISRDGTHAEYLALPEQAVALRPRNLSAEEGAIAGVPFVTAFSAVVRLGQVKRGEWIIVSGAAGAVGQAAIQIAKAKGARTIALVRDATELGIARASNVDAIAQSDQENLESVTREATDGRGADLALNGVGSSIMSSLLTALGARGRQVVYSTAGGREFPLDILSFYQKQAVLLGLNTGVLDATECARILNEMTPLFESEALRPSVIAERHPLAEAAEAYARVTSGKAGKVVLVMSPTPDVARDATASEENNSEAPLRS